MTVYERPPATFEELIAPFPAAVRESAVALRRLILAAQPDADELVSGGLKFGTALYSVGRPTNVACGLQPTAAHCKLYLHHVRPGDVPGLRLEGSGKNARHVKIASASDASQGAVALAIARAFAGASA